METTDSADDGYAQLSGYTAAQAAHTFQEFLAGHLSVRGFAQWLDAYRPGVNAPHDPAVENELNLAILAIRALQQGTRTYQEVHREIQNARGRLTGLARQ